MEKVKLGKHDISRLICGGNPFGGYAHGGGLVYLGRLFREYFTDQRIVETLRLCTEHGVNTALMETDDTILRCLDLYRRTVGYGLQWICQIPPDREGLGLERHLEKQVQIAHRYGAICAFLQGAATEQIISEGRVELLEGLMSMLKKRDMVPGICSHVPHSIEEAERRDLGAEFYMLTLNRSDYHCEDPEASGRLMRRIDKPFIGFKVLGAGRERPEDGFRYAFASGATWIAVGMFDFQVEGNATLIQRILATTDEDRGPGTKGLEA